MLSAGIRAVSAGGSHAGRVRDVNEDAFLARDDVALWAVADGMGGHHRGDTASGEVIEALASIRWDLGPKNRLNAVQRALRKAHERLVAPTAPWDVSGSTVVALLLSGHHFVCVWAGDSRLYRWRRTRLQQLTKDHSLVQVLLDRGDIAPWERGRHPLRHRITSAIGAANAFHLDMIGEGILVGDRYLLCSDGLYECVDNAAIQRACASCEREALVDRLITAALANGAPDNVTVVVVDILPAS